MNLKINKLLIGWIIALISCPLIYLIVYNSIEGLVYGVGVSIGALIVVILGCIILFFVNLKKPKHLKQKPSSFLLKAYIALLLINFIADILRSQI